MWLVDKKGMMECNKDEAIRAKEIAERKFTGRDYSGAKKFALKAQNLYPGLEGLSQIMTTLDVYIAAENKIGGEVDWYGVLGVNPLVDDETMRKNYRKLALMLHPDKNKSIGADGAFKLVSEAWSLLSDKAMRSAYNQRRNSKGFRQKVQTQRGGPSAPFRANDFHNVTNSATSNARAQNSTARMGSTPPPSQSYKKNDTFWTVCHQCKMQYEYLRTYLNHTLLCPNCHGAFLASEKAPPSNVKPSHRSLHQQQRSSNHHAANNNPFNSGRNASVSQNSGLGRSAGHKSFNHTEFQQGPFFRTSSDGSRVASDSAASLAARLVQQVNEKAKREREEALAAARWERRSHMRMSTGLSSEIFNSNSNSVLKGETPLKKGRIDDNHMNSYRGYMASDMGSVCGGRKGSFDPARVYGVSGANSEPISFRELSQLDIRHMLMRKAQMEISKKLKEWSSATKAKAAEKEKEKVKDKGKDKLKSAINANAHDLNKCGESGDVKKGYRANKLVPGTSAVNKDEESVGPMSMNVPDPDFHNFDMDRAESSFGENQVWSAYDDDDGMPRYYAIIHKVLSLNPFKMKISWLNSKSNSEFGTLDWIGSGFAKTCGDFRVGKHEIYKSLNSFSQKVKWTKGTRGVIHIYPREGDVWALYTNWSPDWNEHTPDEVIHKYDMVEVLDDYDEEHGVSVTPLIKLAGFRTVFHRHADPKEIRRIPKEEMFRFSHQVPNYLLTGEESQNVSRGCRELDPAATPLELLQVTTETNEAHSVENVGKPEEEMLLNDMVENVTKAKEKEMVENVEQMKGEEMMVHAQVAEEAEVVHDVVKTTELSCGDC